MCVYITMGKKQVDSGSFYVVHHSEIQNILRPLNLLKDLVREGAESTTTSGGGGGGMMTMVVEEMASIDGLMGLVEGHVVLVMKH